MVDLGISFPMVMSLNPSGFQLYVDDSNKTEDYWAKRVTNNVAARRSRESRRLKVRKFGPCVANWAKITDVDSKEYFVGCWSGESAE